MQKEKLDTIQPASKADENVSAFDVYNDFELAMARLKGLLHGLYASREFWADKQAELALLGLAHELCEEAEDYAHGVYDAWLALDRASGPQKGGDE